MDNIKNMKEMFSAATKLYKKKKKTNDDLTDLERFAEQIYTDLTGRTILSSKLKEPPASAKRKLVPLTILEDIENITSSLYINNEFISTFDSEYLEIKIEAFIKNVAKALNIKIKNFEIKGDFVTVNEVETLLYKERGEPYLLDEAIMIASKSFDIEFEHYSDVGKLNRAEHMVRKA